MATIDQYKIKITVEGKEQVVDLNNSIDKLQGTITKAAAAGVAAFAALGVSALRMADEMSDLADATGISAAKIYQLSAALQASGSDFDNGGTLLRHFSTALGEVENGSAKAQKALTDLGLTKQQIETLSDEQLFQTVVNGLGKMEAGFERTKIATELFGKSAAGIDWKKLADGTNKAVDPELAQRLKDAGDAWDNLQSIFRDLELAVLQAMGPVIKAIKDMNITADDLKQGIKVLGAAIAGAFAAGVVLQIVKVVNIFKQLYQTVRAAGAAAAFLEGLSGVGLAAVAASAVAATAAYKALGAAMEDTADKQGDLSQVVPASQPVDNTKKRIVGATDEEKAQAKALAALQAQTAEMKTQNAAALRYQKILNDTIGMDQHDADVKKLTAQLEMDRADSRAKYEKEIAALRADTTKDNTQQIAQLDLQKNLADAQLVKMYDLKKEALDREQAEKEVANQLAKQLSIIQLQSDQNKANMQADLQRQVVAGKITQEEMDNQMKVIDIQQTAAAKIKTLDAQIAQEKDKLRKQNLMDERSAVEERTKFDVEQAQKAIDDKKKIQDSYLAGITESIAEITKAMTPYQQAQKMVTAAWGEMERAVDKFTETGKFSFKDFALSVLADMAKIQLKAALLPIFTSASSGISNFVTKLLTGGKAEGGPVQGNKPVLVGEKGPELFVPPKSGKIIPNNKLLPGTVQPGLATGTVNAPVTNNYITNNITAMDAKSVAQVFAENRKALFGANKMAEREMSYAGAA